MLNLKCYSFYLVSHKYPKFLGYAYGKDKKDAFETLKLINNYSKSLKLGTKVKGYIFK